MKTIDYNGMTLDEYEREVNRRLCHRKMRAFGEFVGAVALAAMATLLAVAWIASTPDQMSAEYDWADAQHAVR